MNFNAARAVTIMKLTAVLFAAVCFNMPAYAQSAFEDPGSRIAGQAGGDLVAVSETLNVGTITLGSSSQTVILFRNDGNKPITTSDISLYPSSNVSATVGQNECQSAPLPSGAVCAISISVKGLQVGNFRIELLLRHNGRAKLITAAVTGTVDRTDDETYDIINDLEAIPNELNYGDLSESRPLTRSVVLRNVTSKPVKIEDMFIESNSQAGYTFRSDCETLLSGEACIATVTWSPQQRGPSTGVLVVEHDGPTGVVSILLDGSYVPAAAAEVGIFPEAVPGKGLLAASQTAIDFGSDIQTSSAITVSLVNVGDNPLTLNNISISGEDSGLQIVSGGCRPGVSLKPVEACPLTVKWDPTRPGTILDDIKIRHDGARGVLILPVRGTASQAVNKDSQAIVLNADGKSILDAIQPISAASVGAANPSSGASAAASGGTLEGYRITSIGRDRAVVSGPGGSRVIFDGQESVIGATLWKVDVQDSAVAFTNKKQTILLLFDRSLSAVRSGRTGGGTSAQAPQPIVTPAQGQ